MKTLYLMRHGQTMFNLYHKKQGWSDSPLTPLGIGQAKIAGEWFKKNNIKVDHAYCSTSERASDTLELVSDMPYTRLKGLKEINFGVFEASDEYLGPKPPYGDYYKDFGGEGISEALERFDKTIRGIMSKDDHESVLVVSHGGIIANFIRSLEKDNKMQFRFGIKNCSIFVVEVDGDKFSCVDIIEHDFSSLE